MRKQQVIVSIFCILASIHIVAQLSYEPILLTGVFAPTQDSIPSIHTSSTAHIHSTPTRITRSHNDINHARDQAMQHARMHALHRLQHKEHHIALDPLWLNTTSGSVNTRCTVINFLNGPIGSGYPIPASPLPIGFHENFDPRGWGETYVYKTPTQSDYHTAFERDYGRCSKQDRQRHIHAHMRRWAHYYYPSFRAFIKTLDGYESYMLEIAAQLEHDPLFANGVKQAEKSAPEYIRAEKSRITKARAQEAMRAEQTRQAHRIEEQHQHAAQQRTIARTTFAQQHDIVHAYINNNPSRLAAYQQALADNGSTTDHEYHLSTAACAALQHNALSYEPYLRLHGNALQHELLQEIVAGIEDLSVLARPKSAAFNELLYDHTFITFDDARFANERGDCASSAQLIDLATSMKNCLYAIITGTVTGMRDGAHSAVAGAYEMVRHPIQTAHALKHLACTLAHYAHDYLPLEILSEDTASTDWDLYAQRCEETAHNWRIATDQLKKYWHDTPAPELAHQISYIAGNLSANAIVANACLHMLSKAARCVKVERAKRAYASWAALSESELATTSPGSILIKQTHAAVPSTQIGESRPSWARELRAHEKSIEYPAKGHIHYSTSIHDIAKTTPLRFASPPQLIEAGFATEIFFDEIVLQHILEGELVTFLENSGGTVSLKGCHVDYMSELQKNGIYTFTDVVIAETGVIKAHVWHKGMCVAKGKTFFPPCTTREQALERIIEAFNNPLALEWEKNAWAIEGIAFNNIQIKLIVKSSGELITAYPYIKKVT